MFEQRRYKRRHLLFYLDVFEQETGRKLGSLGDLTPKGLLILSERGWLPGEKLAMEVALPDIDGFRNERLFARGTVKWTASDHNPAIQCTGVEFDDLGMKGQALVSLLVQLIGFRD